VASSCGLPFSAAASNCASSISPLINPLPGPANPEKAISYQFS
jgi:hypothetical protein